MDIIATGGPLAEARALRYFQQLVAGLGYCHAGGVAHRDLKLQNLLIDDGDNLKIADFGLCNFVKNAFGMSTLLKTMCGTPNYVAPEVLSSADSPCVAPPPPLVCFGLVWFCLRDPAPLSASLPPLHCVAPPPPTSRIASISLALASCRRALSNPRFSRCNATPHPTPPHTQLPRGAR